MQKNRSFLFLCTLHTAIPTTINERYNLQNEKLWTCAPPLRRGYHLAYTHHTKNDELSHESIDIIVTSLHYDYSITYSHLQHNAREQDESRSITPVFVGKIDHIYISVHSHKLSSYCGSTQQKKMLITLITGSKQYIRKIGLKI